MKHAAEKCWRSRSDKNQSNKEQIMQCKDTHILGRHNFVQLLAKCRVNHSLRHGAHERREPECTNWYAQVWGYEIDNEMGYRC